MKTDSAYSRAFRRLVERAQEETFFLGRALKAYREVHALDDEELGSWLGCPSVEALNRLRLCRLPNERSETFAREVRLIGSYGPCDPERLVKLLREVLALEALREVTPVESRSLLAARDHRRSKDDNGSESGSE